MLQPLKKAMITPLQHADAHLIDQFYVTLLSCYERVLRSQEASGSTSLQALRELLDQEPRSWRSAYHAEQQLVPFLSDAELGMEMERRMIDAKGMLSPTVYGAYQKALGRIEGLTGTSAAQQQRASKEALLARLINDLQWKYEVAEGKKVLGRTLTKRTAWTFIILFFLFAVYILVATGILLSGASSAEAVNTNVIGQPVNFYFFSIGLAILAGCLGACFSMLTGLKGRLERGSFDDLKIMCTRANIGTRVLIGICAGLIVYYFIRAGLLTGPLVPDLVVKAAPYDLFTNLALLVVWCFLGGFSEKLVPTLLSKTEKQAGIVGEGESTAPPPASTPVSISGDGALTATPEVADLTDDVALEDIGDTAPAEAPEATLSTNTIAPAEPETGGIEPGPEESDDTAERPGG